MISLTGIEKRYSTHVAIGPIDLDLPAGGITALIGPNGAGKSTLLTMIGRLLEADAGREDPGQGSGPLLHRLEPVDLRRGRRRGQQHRQPRRGGVKPVLRLEP